MTTSASSIIANSCVLPDVHRTDEAGLVVHHAHESVDEVVNVAETARLLTVAINGDIGAVQRLGYEIAHDTTIARMHPRTVRVEDPDDANVHPVLTVVVE